MKERELKETEKQRCRALWEKAFSEDSRSFTDYYFREKIKDNRVFVLEDEEKIVSMLHRNPYRIAVGENEWLCDYIVGVATLPEYRRRGYMRRLLKRAMSDMQQEGMPFCFLMPADERLYLPFGFSYIFRQPEFSWKEGIRDSGTWVPYDSSDRQETAEWLHRFLKKNYEVFTVRDEKYLMRIEEEMKSEAGIMEWLIKDGKKAAFYGEWGLSKREQRFLYCMEDGTAEMTGANPAIMARILDLPRFLSGIRLSDECTAEKLCVELCVKDEILPLNSGRFCWCLNHQTSWLSKPSKTEADLFVSIDDMATWLFGYGLPESVASYARRIRPLQNIFLDEIV